MFGDSKLDVIKYAGDNDNVVYKFDVEDFNSKSQLIVNESQEAIFYKDGMALDLFPSGRHPLTTDSVPLLKKFFNAIFHKGTPFTCSVVFVNKVTTLDLLWGTDQPITVDDPKYHLLVGVRANGSFGVRVKDTRKFVVKIVGQTPSFEIDDVKRTVKGMLLATIKDVLGKILINGQVSVLDINGMLSEISAKMKDQLNPIMDEIGLECTNFYVNGISCKDDDLVILKATRERYMEQMNEIELAAKREVMMGEALAKSRAAQGFTYQEERKFDVLEGAAKNEGSASAGIMGAGIGLGMGAGIGAGIGSAAMDAGKAMNSQVQQQPAAAPASGAKCANCGAALPASAKFCAECGTPVPQNKFCPECGAKVAPGAKFCPECGTKLQ